MNKFLILRHLLGTVCFAPESEGASGGEGSASPAVAHLSPSQPASASPTEPPVSGGEAAPGQGHGEAKPAGTAVSTDPEKKEGEGTGEDKTEATEDLLSVEAIKAPEGMEFDPDSLKNFVDIVNDKSLSATDRGQKLVDLQVSLMQQAAKSAGDELAQSWTEMQEKWRTELEALPTFKGLNVEQELGEIRKACRDAGAGEEFEAAMSLTGAGNNPHILAVLQNLTKPYREGKIVSGGDVRKAPSMEERLKGGLYTSMKQG